MTKTETTLAQVAKPKRGRGKTKPEYPPRKPTRSREEISRDALARRERETKERDEAIADQWRIAAEEALKSGSIHRVRLPKLNLTR